MSVRAGIVEVAIFPVHASWLGTPEVQAPETAHAVSWRTAVSLSEFRCHCCHCCVVRILTAKVL